MSKASSKVLLMAQLIALQQITLHAPEKVTRADRAPFGILGLETAVGLL